MLKILYEKRGSGKTKKMIGWANTAVKEIQGDIVFIDDNNRAMLDLHHDVRYINAKEYDASTTAHLTGFIKGVLAQDYDIKQIYVDGFPKLVGLDDATQMKDIIASLNKLAEKFEIDIILSVSGPEGQLPEFMKEYVI